MLRTDKTFAGGESFINVLGVRERKALKMKNFDFTALTFIEVGNCWRVMTDFEHMLEMGT